MQQETDEQARPLRTGLTTGTCATACSLAAAYCLFTGSQPETVQVHLPKGQLVSLSVFDYHIAENTISVSTQKDAGDDPDVTHQAIISAQVRLIEHGFIFKAGQGVGMVTRDGLPIPVGEPAINPVPRQMIKDHLIALAQKYDYNAGFEITISIQNGEALAQKTMNPRLGIMGGLSVLGTSGIVRPFSCSAYIASVHRGIDVARANQQHHIAACTGNASERFTQQYYDLPDMALIEMGDFAGAVLKYLKRHPVKRLTICGGFGKLSKLAHRHLDLHSRASSISFEQLVQWAAELGANTQLQQQIHQANTSLEALKLCQQYELDLAKKVCMQAQSFAQSVVGDEVKVEVFAVDRAGQLLGYVL